MKIVNGVVFIGEVEKLAQEELESIAEGSKEEIDWEFRDFIHEAAAANMRLANAIRAHKDDIVMSDKLVEASVVLTEWFNELNEER